MQENEPKAAVDFIMDFAVALNSYGAAANHIEKALKRLAMHSCHDGQFFAAPTSISADIELKDGSHSSRLRRVKPGGIDLSKLSYTDEVGDMIMENSITYLEGRDRIQHISTMRPTYPNWLSLLAFSLTSASFATLLGASYREVLVAPILGFLAGCLYIFLTTQGKGHGIIEATISFIVSFGAGFASHFAPQIDPKIATLSGLIVLVPGLSITTALLELSTKNLVAGTARLMGAITELLTMAFGVALGFAAVSAIFTDFNPAIIATLSKEPAQHRIVVVPFVALTFAILFQTRYRDVPWVILGTIFTYTCCYITVPLLGQTMGTFMAGTALGIYGNTFSRILRRPALITLLPGIILLVPGSIGYKSVSLLFDQKVLSSISLGFEMLIIGVALSAGISLGRAAINPKRSY